MKDMIALKIDVDTYRGTQVGVPQLLDVLDRHGVRATFLFSLGPDHTGRALKRAFRPGFLSKVKRTSVVSHYGLKTLMYGTLLPGPDIGKRCASGMRAVQDAGHEVGVHCYDHVRWQDTVAHADAEWTELEMRRAAWRFASIFNHRPLVHGAAGWQMNDAAFALTEQLEFSYSSDTRGTGPFFPAIGGRVIRCPQLPTTLPTLDELIGRDDLIANDPVQHLLSLTAQPHAHGHVYTLHAELEGMKLMHSFDLLLARWRAQGWQLGSLEDSFAALDLSRVPICAVSDAVIPGRSGTLSLQTSS